MLTIAIAFLTVIEVIAALLLIGIILIQQSKSGGGLGAMGGGITETVFGASAGNVLTKGTVILTAVFLTTTLLLAILTGHRRPGASVVETQLTQPQSAETTPLKPGPDSKNATGIDKAAETTPAPAAAGVPTVAPEPPKPSKAAKPTGDTGKSETPAPAK